MRKLTGIILVAAMIIGLTACGEEKRQIDENTVILKLALREGTYADVIKECVGAFEEKNNVFCEVEELSEDDLHAKVADGAADRESSYDICMVDSSWMAECTAKGTLSNLSDMGYELDDDIIPATKEICYYQDDVYLVPYFGNVTVLLYSRALVGASDYDADSIDSLQDILKICKESQARGNLGFMYRGDTENNIVVDFLPILLSYGGWVVDEENRPTVDTEEFRSAMEYYLELIATGDDAEKDDLISAIANDAAAMGIGWPGWYTVTEKSSAAYDALTGKADADSIAYNANVYGVWTIGIPQNSTKKEMALKLMEYLMDANVQKSTVELGGVPCRYSSLKDEEILEKYPQYEQVCQALEGGVYRPVMENWSDFYTILGEEMRSILNEDKSIEQGLSDAQKRLEQL